MEDTKPLSLQHKVSACWYPAISDDRTYSNERHSLVTTLSCHHAEVRCQTMVYNMFMKFKQAI
jgi:hypothetical protein